MSRKPAKWYNWGMAQNTTIRSFEGRLGALPTAPGCYIMKDSRGRVLYVGKAKQLRDRVRSYFGAPRSLTAKTRDLVAHIADFEVVRTDTEAEALILENELIKRHQPKYNILLKDDKTYPYLKITNEEWPTIVSTRRVLKDGGQYFGPFADARAAYSTLKVLHRTFPYRKPNAPCKNKKLSGDWARPCQYYHMRQCLGMRQGGSAVHLGLAQVDRGRRRLPGERRRVARRGRLRCELLRCNVVKSHDAFEADHCQQFAVMAEANGRNGRRMRRQYVELRPGRGVPKDDLAIVARRGEDYHYACSL